MVSKDEEVLNSNLQGYYLSCLLQLFESLLYLFYNINQPLPTKVENIPLLSYSKLSNCSQVIAEKKKQAN